VNEVTPFPKRPRVVNRSVQPRDPSPLMRGECPCCRRPTRDLSRAHVVPKGLYGDDVPENVVWICGDGTRGCHGVLTHRNLGDHGLTHEHVASAFVAYVRTLEETVAYIADVKYDGWLDAYYAVKEAA
jgi:hypothetical protein